MGYTTKFSGSIGLSRPLTLKEAKSILEINDMDREEAMAITGVNAYMQWVPTVALNGIMWDGNEKFYEYTPQLKWLCGWLKEQGIAADGFMNWSGEDASDNGIIVVIENNVTASEKPKSATKIAKPLTLSALQQMALEQVTQ